MWLNLFKKGFVFIIFIIIIAIASVVLMYK